MQNGLLSVQMRDGISLPVVDITHPAFAVSVSEQEMDAMARQYVDEASRFQAMPAAMRDALRQSMLGGALMASAGTFLPGIPTYMLKLGPENLGAFASDIDRRIAASFPALCVRLRLQDVASLMAGGLASAMEADAKSGLSRPVCLMNIGGGPASDSWNALILLRGKGLLEGRTVRVGILDPDVEGPAFGARAMEALVGSDATLNGVKVEVRHFVESWVETDEIAYAIKILCAEDALCAISSEGALFEYGADDEIVEALKVVHKETAHDAIVVGSVTREGECTRASQMAVPAATQPRTLEGFSRLAEAGGWRVQCAIERPFSYQVRLVKVHCTGKHSG